MVEFYVTSTEHSENDAQTFPCRYGAHVYAQLLVETGFTPAIEVYRDASTQVLTWQGLCDLVSE